jgi:hypothetical protein
MDFPRREIFLVLQRNEAKDEQVGSIQYSGYDVHWPSGRRVRGLAFDRFCKIGVRYLLGRDKPKRAAIRLFFVPLEGAGAPLPRVPGCRVRPLYLERAGADFKLFLSDGSPTDITFNLRRDEKGILDWIGAGGIADGGRQWFGMYAVRATAPGLSVPAAQLASRTGAAAF